MERWLRIRANDHGEWSVLDIERNYRVCSFHDALHGGPHVHDGARTYRTDIESVDVAKAVVREYAKKYETFKRAAFEVEAKRWKSRRNNG